MTKCARIFFFFPHHSFSLLLPYFLVIFFPLRLLHAQASVPLYVVCCGAVHGWGSAGRRTCQSWAALPSALSPPLGSHQRPACQGPRFHCAAKEFTPVKALLGFSSPLFIRAAEALSLLCCRGLTCVRMTLILTRTQRHERRTGGNGYNREGMSRHPSCVDSGVQALTVIWETELFPPQSRLHTYPHINTSHTHARAQMHACTHTQTMQVVLRFGLKIAFMLGFMYSTKQRVTGLICSK